MERPLLRERKSARLLVMNADGDVLLFKYLTRLVTPRLYAKGIPHFWATPGGGLDPGESFEDAATRELFEETGWNIQVQSNPVLEREFKMQFQTEWVWAVEKYFAVRAPNDALRTTGFTELERDTLSAHAWWSASALRAATTELIFPEELADVVTRLNGQAKP